MAKELRLYYDDEYIDLVAKVLAEEVADPAALIGFPKDVLAPPWADMALKQRWTRLTETIAEYLPKSYEDAADCLKRILIRLSGPEVKFSDMLSMFIPEYVIQNGQCHWDISMDAMEHFTHHGTTSEFAIRPFLLADLPRAMTHMRDWATHPHPSVRRFASEGCRPRLPWAVAIPALKKDPTLLLPILETLRRDDSAFVRNSVANNLNDISKDHPDITLDFATRHMGSDQKTDRMLKHACRSLLKQGHPKALALFGAAPVQVINPELSLNQADVLYGTCLTFTFSAMLDGPLPASLRLEYAVDFMKSRGKPSVKVFKISEGAPKRQIKLTKSYRFKDLTTRKHYAGAHSISIIVNGNTVASAPFTLHKDA